MAQEIIGKWTSPDNNRTIQIYQGPGSKVGVANLAYYVKETNKETNTSQRISLSTTAAINFIDTLSEKQWIRS